MRVLHILNTGKYSGAENVVCQIIGMFRDQNNIQMAYCSLEGSIREVLGNKNIEFFPVSKMKASEIRKVIKMYRPDLVHAHDMKASFVAALVCKNIPLISHIHNNSFTSRKLSSKSIAFLFAAHKAKTILWVSNSSRDGYYFKDKVASKSLMLCNAINPIDLMEQMDNDNNSYHFDVVYVGRLSYEKDPFRLIDVIEKAVRLYPSLRVAIIGTGDLENEVNSIILRKQLNRNVSALGYKNNPLKIMHDSKVMIMTSRWEGMPMVALEAIALGVPIVSTPTDGMVDLVEEGQTGFLSDDNQILAEAIVRIVKDEALHRALSCKQLTLSNAINNISHYKDVLLGIYNQALKDI